MTKKRPDGSDATTSSRPGVVAIGGIDPTGGAGILADVRHLLNLGARAGAAATAIVPQDMRRVRALTALDLGGVLGQVKSAIEVVSPQVVKFSMLPTPEIALGVALEVNTWRRKTGGMAVYDPVLKATVGGRLSAEPGPWLGEPLGAADVLTPNLEEAREIVGALEGAGRSKEDPSSLGGLLSSHLAHDGPGAVVIKSARPGTDLVVGRTGGRGSPLDELWLPGDLIDARVRGTGCAHACGVAAHLALGESVPRAAAMAKWYVEEMMFATERSSRGGGLLVPVEPRWDPRAMLLEGVAAAAAELQTLLDHDSLPEVGSNIAYALPLARDLSEVAALDSRIVRHGKGVRSHGSAAFGVDSHMARMSLAASNVDLRVRSSCNLRYSPALVAAARRAGLRVARLDRTLEGTGETMRWLVQSAARRRAKRREGSRGAQPPFVGFAKGRRPAGRASPLPGGEHHPLLPDAIFDTGAPGKEAMVRFLGRDPEAVVGKIRAALAATREERMRKGS